MTGWKIICLCSLLTTLFLQIKRDQAKTDRWVATNQRQWQPSLVNPGCSTWPIIEKFHLLQFLTSPQGPMEATLDTTGSRVPSTEQLLSKSIRLAKSSFRWNRALHHSKELEISNFHSKSKAMALKFPCPNSWWQTDSTCTDSKGYSPRTNLLQTRVKTAWDDRWVLTRYDWELVSTRLVCFRKTLIFLATSPQACPEPQMNSWLAPFSMACTRKTSFTPSLKHNLKPSPLAKIAASQKATLMQLISMGAWVAYSSSCQATRAFNLLLALANKKSHSSYALIYSQVQLFKRVASQVKRVCPVKLAMNLNQIQRAVVSNNLISSNTPRI